MVIKMISRVANDRNILRWDIGLSETWYSIFAELCVHDACARLKRERCIIGQMLGGARSFCVDGLIGGKRERDEGEGINHVDFSFTIFFYQIAFLRAGR